MVKRGSVCSFPQWPIGAIHSVRLAGYGRCEQHLGEGCSGDASRDSIESGSFSFRPVQDSFDHRRLSPYRSLFSTTIIDLDVS
jgi:hypothetical protein